MIYDINEFRNIVIESRGTFLIKIFALMIGGVFAGYTVTDMDPRFLKLFEKWYLQLFIYFFIAFSFFDSDMSKWSIMLISAIIFTVFIRLMKTYINNYYKNIDKKKNKNKLLL